MFTVDVKQQCNNNNNLLANVSDPLQAASDLGNVFMSFTVGRSIVNIYSRLSLSRLRLSRITANLEEKIWFFFKRRNLTPSNKILWIREEIAAIFSIYISNYIYLFVKFDCSIVFFLNSAHLICRSTDISKCFRG